MVPHASAPQNRQHSSRLGPALRVVRRAAGLTQAELAEAAGMTRATVISVEAGRGSTASFLTLLRYHGNVIRGRSLPPGDNLGLRLAELRRRRGLSRATVAALAGMTDSTLATIERGELGHLALLHVALTLGAALTLAPMDAKSSVWSGAALSSVYHAWTTPPTLLQKLYPLVGGEFHVDPCSPRPDGAVRARIRLTTADDGLSIPWPPGSIFCNPPLRPGDSGVDFKMPKRSRRRLRADHRARPSANRHTLVARYFWARRRGASKGPPEFWRWQHARTLPERPCGLGRRRSVAHGTEEGLP